MDYRRPLCSFAGHRRTTRLTKRRAESNCEMPAKQAATEELMAEHLQQLYIDPTAAAAFPPPNGGYPLWHGQMDDVAMGNLWDARSRPEDDEMTSIMSKPHRVVPDIRLTPPTPVSSEHVKAPPPKWRVVLEDLDGEESDEEATSEVEDGELTVELSPEVHQHLKSSTSHLLAANRLRPSPCLAVVPWTPPGYFIARALALSDSQSDPEDTHASQHTSCHESMES